MKLAAVYNVYDSEELLPYSINSIRDVVDTIIVVYQNISNYGNHHPRVDLLSFLSGLEIDVLIKYEPQINSRPEHNERVKRTMGCKKAVEYGCTHYIFLDCDECYDQEQFLSAKQNIVENDYDATACLLATYYKSPTYRLVPNEMYYVPFISKLQKGVTKFGNFAEYPVHTDPTRKSWPFANFKAFARDELIMHHYTMVRQDIGSKFKNNTTLGQRKNDYNTLIEQFNNFAPGDKPTYPFENYDIEVVENKFNIPNFFEHPDEDTFNFLVQLCEKLKKHKIDFWLSSGTYLSLYREDRFFPWDIDIDLDLFGDNLDVPKFIDLMKKLGLNIYKKVEKHDKLQQIIFSVPKLNRLIDFYIYYLEGDEYTTACDVGFMYLPKNLLDDIQDITFRGAVFPCPEPDEYFSVRYGPDWRTPKQVSGLPGGGWEITKNLIRS